MISKRFRDVVARLGHKIQAHEVKCNRCECLFSETSFIFPNRHGQSVLYYVGRITLNEPCTLILFGADMSSERHLTYAWTDPNGGGLKYSETPQGSHYCKELRGIV